MFVSNVLSGTVSRFNVAFPAGGGVQVVSATQIASGFPHHGDPAAFEVGPGGLAFDAATGNLYVASEADNSIYVIPNALRTRGDHGTGRLVVHDDMNLHGPIGLTLASDGHLIVANSDGNNANPADPSTLVEYTRGGRFLGKFSLDPTNGGAFAVTITPGPRPLPRGTSTTSPAPSPSGRSTAPTRSSRRRLTGRDATSLILRTDTPARPTTSVGRAGVFLVCRVRETHHLRAWQ